jgi:hypothetical protein
MMNAELKDKPFPAFHSAFIIPHSSFLLILFILSSLLIFLPQSRKLLWTFKNFLTLKSRAGIICLEIGFQFRLKPAKLMSR